MKESEIIKRIAKNWDKQREEKQLEVKEKTKYGYDVKSLKLGVISAIVVLPISKTYYCISP